MTPVRIAPDTGPWPLHDVASSRAAEAAAQAVTPAHALMQRAGFSVARLALARFPHARRIAVIAGPGNNGGDGLVAATHLHRAGQQVQVSLLGDAGRLPADAADAFARAREAGVSISDHLDGRPCDVVIDALFGLGTRRAAEGAMAAAIRAMNGGSAPVLAIDLPSCLNADTGQPVGALAVRAYCTLSLLSLKPGLFTGQGRDLAGEVWFDGLGVAAAGATAELSGPAPRVARPHASHKGSFGDVAVVGGAPGMAGAAWLAAGAALAAGAGRVYLAALDDAAVFDTARPELMMRRRWWNSPPQLLASTSVVCGCGGGSGVREALPPLIAFARDLVLDADALNAIAADPALRQLLRARAARARAPVLTPHPLEAARLLDSGAADVQADRLAAAAALAERYQSVVLLKGSGSVIAAPGMRPSVNASGNARLATPGSGDVLAGWIGGLAAQHGDGRRAAIEAAWQHGRAAELDAGAGPLLAADLIAAMRRV